MSDLENEEVHQFYKTKMLIEEKKIRISEMSIQNDSRYVRNGETISSSKFVVKKLTQESHSNLPYFTFEINQKEREYEIQGG